MIKILNNQTIIEENVVLGLLDQTPYPINITIYPNPTNEFVNIYFSAPLKKETTISITNIQGKVLRRINTSLLKK